MYFPKQRIWISQENNSMFMLNYWNFFGYSNGKILFWFWTSESFLPFGYSQVLIIW